MKRTFLPVIVTILLALLLPILASAQVNILTQGFEGATYPPTGWSNVRITGPSLPGVWTRVTAGTYPVQAPHAGTYELRYNSHNYLLGTSGDIRSQVLDFSISGTYSVGFWMYRDNWTGNDKMEVYVNTVQTSVGGTLMGTINRDMNQSPFEVSNGWYHYSLTVPGGFTGVTNYIIFKATSAYGNDMYMDDITVDRLPPAYPGCLVSFTPASGTTGYCMNASMDWSSVAAASGYKITMGSNSPGYNNVANNLDIGASLSYSIVLSASTTYGWKIIPYNAFGDATGCSFNTFSTGSSLCYCVPVYVDGDCASQDYIKDFYTTGGSTNISNVGSGCTMNTNNYTYWPAKNVTTTLGGSFNVYMQSGIDYGQGYGVWIDWNQDGDFSDAGEYVFASGSATIALVSGTVTVPMTATTGTTRLRVRCAYNYIPTTSQSCTTFTEGETEDYNVIIPSPVLPITLYDFYGEPNADADELFWTAENEVNTNYYLISKSADGISFSAIATVPATGNTSGVIQYRLTDDAPFTGTNYYKLSVVDMNGNEIYSEIISMNNLTAANTFNVFPNPASEILHIANNENIDQYLVHIFDLSGKMVFEHIFSGKEADINVSELNSGVYLINVFTEKGSYEKKIVIQ